MLTPIKYLSFTIALIMLSACSKDETASKTSTLEMNASNIDNHTSTLENNISTIENNTSTSEVLPWTHGVLKVSDNKHFLQHKDGTGFFWMADTAWHLAAKLVPKDIDTYLNDRKKRGFNVILFSASEHSNITNEAIKADAFTDANWKTPNEKYWKNVDYVVNKAEEVGLYVGILPAWDQTSDKSESENPGLLKVEDAKHYGDFIANRYKNKPNIIWVIGGDTDNIDKVLDDKNVSKKLAWEALGSAIKKVVKEKQLMTFHVRGISSSSDRFNEGEATWIDFDMSQSGHCQEMARGVGVTTSDYLKGNKPTVDAESRYEDIVECFYLSLAKRPKPNEEYRFIAKDVRKMAYKQIFSGAFGHTYGHQSIWHMSPKAQPNHEIDLYSTTMGWKDALKAKGATQMGYIVKLMKSRDMLSRIPDNTMIENNSTTEMDEENAVATRGDGYAFVYIPKGGKVTVKLGIISGETLNATWFNPSTGETKKIETLVNSGSKNFDTEGTKDMVLILDDASKDYKNP